MSSTDAELDSDEALLEGFRGGDERAFSALVQRYQERLRAVAHRYVRNSEDAKDIAQRAFAKAFEQRASFRGESSIGTWLFRIAINLALSHMRRHPAQVSMSEIEDVRAFTHGLQTSKLVAAEVWRRVVDRLDALPPKQRLLVELRLFHELSFEEAAVVADCSVEAARANYHHGLSKLRSLIPAPGAP